MHQQFFQDMMEESVNEDTTEQELSKYQIPISVNYRRISSEIDIATALLARDWRGFGSSTEMSNGVITI